MEQYTALILTFLGGSTVPMIIGYFLARKRNSLDMNGTRDEQILKWADKALDMADELLTVKGHIAKTEAALEEYRRRCGACENGPVGK